MLASDPSGLRTLLASAMAAGLAGQAPSHHQPPIPEPPIPPPNPLTATPLAACSPPQRFSAQAPNEFPHTPSGQASEVPARGPVTKPPTRGSMSEQELPHNPELAAARAAVAGSRSQQGVEQQLPGQLLQPRMQHLLGALTGPAGGAPTLDQQHIMAALRAPLQHVTPSNPRQDACQSGELNQHC